jgi:hypothetical protein
MDSIIEEMLGEKLIRPRDIVDLQWPLLDEARGKFILILDEGGASVICIMTDGNSALCLQTHRRDILLLQS